MDLQLSRDEKEHLLQRVTDVAFADILNKMDAAVIIEICLNACKRQVAEMEKEIGPACDIIQ